MKNYILCCDWGTSFFRLGLLNLNDNQLIGELHSNIGIAGMFNEWNELGKANVIDKVHFFQANLRVQINILAEKLSVDLAQVPLLISGMASSSIGMEDIPYADLPFAMDGTSANIKWFESHLQFPHQIMLVSGVRSAKDVMRGEETQLIGVVEQTSDADFYGRQAVFIFPGTHSKHIYVDKKELVDIKTYMTGELFGLMAESSILKDSVAGKQTIDLSDSELAAFKSGVLEAQISNMLFGLFTVRTNQLFGKLDKAENYFYLSGLLIGTELKYLCKTQQWHLVLCSSSKLQVVYKLAIEELKLAERSTIIAADMVDKAAFVGQARIFKNQSLLINNQQHRHNEI